MKTTSLSVISGKFKGAKLLSPASHLTHPMGSREKLALFNILGPYLDGSIVLDAYAGSGALGIEALSRGVRSVTFVEKSPKIAQTIRQNLRQLDLEPNLYVEPVAQFARRESFQEYFDLLLVDPPYDDIDVLELATLIPLLKPGGILALSFPRQLSLPELPELSLLSTHSYAAATIAIYQKITDTREEHAD